MYTDSNLTVIGLQNPTSSMIGGQSRNLLSIGSIFAQYWFTGSFDICLLPNIIFGLIINGTLYNFDTHADKIY